MTALGQYGTVAGLVGKVGIEPNPVDQAVAIWLAAPYI
jgi:hypothetical protein